MLYLYHAPPSVCAMKVGLVLKEKGLPWDGKILDLRRGDSGEPLGRRRLDDAAESIDGHAVFPHRGRLVNQERLGDALDLLGRRHAAGVVLVNTRLGELGLDVGRLHRLVLSNFRIGETRTMPQKVLHDDRLGRRHIL